MTEGKIVNDEALDVLYRNARTFNDWKNQEVSDVLIKAVYDLTKWAPTSTNCSPARFKFVKGEEAKQRLKPHLAEGNVGKTMSAPVTAIIAHDLEFYEQLPKLSPHNNAKSWFEGNDKMIKDTAYRNGTLQGGYFIIAARALGLDCGPMSGFDQQGVKNEFFPDQNVEVNFLCNLGYGDESSLYPRAPRFEFSDICEIL